MPDMREGGLGTAACYLTVERLALLMSPVAVNPGTAFADTTQVTICAAESDGDEKEAGSYGKTGGIGLAPAIAILGASSVACLTLAHRLGKGDDGEISDV